MTLFARNAPVLETDALAHSSVLCVGLGSGGSTVADLLARSGVGRFVLWDHDSLEPHNVARHICTQRDLGRPKAQAMRDHILSINPAAQVETVNRDVVKAGAALAEAVAGVDCVVAGTDNNASRFAINAAAVGAAKPAFYGRAFTRAYGENGNELIFDPPTGELHSTRSTEDPDRVPATRMAREGFFAASCW